MSASRIHPRAIVDPSAIVEDDVEIGPGAVIDAGVRIGAGSRILANATLLRGTTLGPRCTVFPGAVIGGPPQDRNWKGEPTRVECGADNIFREAVTINTATGEGGVTRIGDRCFFMACSHAGHNCTVGNDVVLVNGAVLGGHVTVEDRAFLGGNAMVHQFARVGTLAMLGGGSAVAKDVPPYMTCVGIRPWFIVGPNTIGLRRAGISPEARCAIRRAFHTLYRSDAPWVERVAALADDPTPEVQRILSFIRGSKRGVTARGGRRSEMAGAPGGDDI